MKKFTFPQAIKPFSVFVFLGLFFYTCQRDEPYLSERQPTNISLTVPEDVMVYMEFTSKTTMYTEPAEHVDQTQLSADQKHAVMSGKVPVIIKKRQSFQIKKDKSYRIVIETLEPDRNPAREAFRNETRMNDW